MNLRKELIALAQNILGAFKKVYTESDMKVSDKVIGGKVEFILPDGELAPVEDGEYDFDGFVFTCKDGQITAIQGQDAPAEEAPVEAAVSAEDEIPTEEVETPAEDATPTEEVPEEPKEDPRIPEMEAKITELESKLSEVLDILKGQSMAQATEMEAQTQAIEAFSATVKELNEKISILAKVPVQFSKTNNTQSAEESKADKLSVLAGIIGKR